MASVNFLYRSTRDKSNLSLRLLFRLPDDNEEKGYKDYVFGAKTKLQVESNYWKNQHFKKRIKDVDISNKQLDINKELNRIRKHILEEFNNTTPNSINKLWLQKHIDYYYNPPQKVKIPTELIKFLDFYKEYRKNELKQTSIKNLKVIQNKLKRFEAYRGKIILIKDVNDEFKNEFVKYYKLEKYSQNTTQKEFSYLKTYCRFARFLGLETHHQLDFLTIKPEKVEKIYLSFEELETIQNIDKGELTESLTNARDWLIISCYTGQRISDFMNFNKNMLRQVLNKKGELITLIEFTQKKTGKIMAIPLKQNVLDILNKRNGEFPKPISDQKYNDYIKLVGRLAGLTTKIKGSKKLETEPNSKIYRKTTGLFEKCELLTSHIGRRSFASNFYGGDIPTSLLINITGHSTERRFLSYIGKSNKDLALELTNYF